MFRKVVFLLLAFCTCSLTANAIDDIFVTDTMSVLPADMQLRQLYLDAICCKKRGKTDSTIALLKEYISRDTTNGAVYMDLGNMAIQQNKVNDAVNYMAKAAALEPDNYWIQRTYALLLVRTNHFTKASTIYEKIVADYPQKTENFETLAAIYKQQKEYKKSIDLWNRYEAQNGVIQPVSIEKYNLYMLLGKKKQAFAELDALEASDKTNCAYKIIKGESYLSNSKWKDAEKCFQNIKNSYPDCRKDANLELADLYLSRGKSDKAAACINEVINDSTLSFEEKRSVLVSVLSDSVLSGQFDSECYKKLIKQYPNEEYAYLLYANYLLSDGDTTGFNYVKYALNINPTNTGSWMILLDYYSRNDSVAYENMVSKAVAANPTNGVFRLMQGSIEMIRDHKEAAVADWKLAAQYLKADEKEKLRTSIVLGMVGDYYMTVNNVDSASVYYEEALKYNEDNISVLNNYAYTLAVNKKNLDKAEQMSGKAVANSPQSATFLDTYAWVYYMKGDLTFAEMYIQQALDFGGKEEPDVIEHYGDILYAKGEKEQAREQWKKALEMNKKPSDALKQKVETGELK